MTQKEENIDKKEEKPEKAIIKEEIKKEENIDKKEEILKNSVIKEEIKKDDVELLSTIKIDDFEKINLLTLDDTNNQNLKEENLEIKNEDLLNIIENIQEEKTQLDDKKNIQINNNNNNNNNNQNLEETNNYSS